MEYDVYYATGGLNMIGGGADVWVNQMVRNDTTTFENRIQVIDT